MPDSKPNTLAGARSVPAWAPALLAGMALFLLCAVTVLNGYYFDDEINDLRVVSAKSYGMLLDYANHFDVHPPGAYLINKALSDLLGSWPAVKIFGGALQALADGVLILAVAPRMQRKALVIFACLLATCSTQMLWGSSVRWYAYFTPVYLVAAAMLLAQHRFWKAELAGLAAASIVLFYINYEAAVVVPALWLLFGLKRVVGQPRQVAVVRLAGAALAAIAVLAAIAPQIMVLISNTMGQAKDQFSSIPVSAAGVAYTLTIGNGVFPLSWPALVGLAGLALALVVSARKLAGQSLYREAALIVIVAGAGLALSGLGGKFRNATPLLPIASIVWAGALATASGPVGAASLLAVAVLQLASVRNVILHDQTAKGSFNKPYGAVLKALAAPAPGCTGKYVLAQDVVLTYLVEQRGYALSSPFLDGQSSRPIALSPGACLYVVLSDGGGLAPQDAQRFSTFSPPPSLQPVQQRQIGQDPLAGLKSRMGGTKKSAAFDFRLYRVQSPTQLPRWIRGGASASAD